MNKSIQIALIVALLASLAGGLALWQWWQAQPVADVDASAFAAQSEANLLQLQTNIAERLAEKPAGEVAERLDSPLGQALLRACSEWTEFDDNHPSDMTRAQKEEACTKFRRYVQNGVAPE